MTNFKFRPSCRGDEKSGEHHEQVSITPSIYLPLAPSLYFILEPSLFYHWGLGVKDGCLSGVAAMQYVILGGGHVTNFKFRPSCRGDEKTGEHRERVSITSSIYLPLAPSLYFILEPSPYFILAPSPIINYYQLLSPTHSTHKLYCPPLVPCN